MASAPESSHERPDFLTALVMALWLAMVAWALFALVD